MRGDSTYLRYELINAEDYLLFSPSLYMYLMEGL